MQASGVGAVREQGRRYAARKTCEVVQWPGCKVTGVAVNYHGLGGDGTRLSVPEVQQAPGLDSSDLSDVDNDVVDPFADMCGYEFGKGSQTENLGAVKPIQTLESQHAHNPNLVKQFEHLSQAFKAWRPVRGDGNCYYRAVLFAWLERSVALGRVDDLKVFDANVQRLKHQPMLTASVRICHRVLKKWAAQRAECKSDTQVRTLLFEVSDEFNKVRSDQAFIQCLRHLVAEYMRQHAHEPSGGGDGEVLTYEAWAMALSSAEENIRNIDDFCERKVLMMNEDAADLVQPVCPKVLGTVVRICAVERNSSRDPLCIDYGPGPTRSAPVQSAAQLANVNVGGGQPQIFLLLKPGHYDILIPHEGVGKLLGDPERGLGGLGERSPEARRIAQGSGGAGHPGSPNHGDHQAQLLQRTAEQMWQSFVRLANDVIADFASVLQVLDDKIVEELTAKRKRLGSFDDSMFEGQLSSVIHPLREKLRRFKCVPSDSPFSPEKELSEAPPMQSLLPKLTGFYTGARPGATSNGVAKAGVPAPAGPRAIPVEVQVQPVATGQQAKAKAVAGPAVAVRQPAATAHECCICIQPGAEIAATCGCWYHIGCLREYVSMEGKQAEEVRCHLHNHLMGSSFVMQHVPGFTLKSPQGMPPQGAANMPPTTKFLPGNPSALAQAQPIGLQTQKELNALLAAELPAGKSPTPAVSSSSFSGPRPSPVMVKPGVPDTGMLPLAPPTGKMHGREAAPGLVMSEAPLPSQQLPQNLMSQRNLGVPATTKKLPATGVLPKTGNLGASFGIPCVICFGDQGVLKTLHCCAKAHPSCLKDYWSQRVRTLHRLNNIDCPAGDVAGCQSYLIDEDLRGVVDPADLDEAKKHIQNVDDENLKLIQELKAQQEEYRPQFTCAICLTDHEVEGCCTLPCQHRFCFESLQYHFDIIVRERRLNKLTCPVDGCGYNLRSEEHIHIFQQCLSDESYHKLLEFLTRDLKHIYDCRHLGCEERVFMDDEDDFSALMCAKGHRFCAHCENGPHRGMTCDERQEQIDQHKKAEQDMKQEDDAWRVAMAQGWKPCPMRCSFGGGFKNSEECDHVTCECGFEFCWDCGIARKVAIVHDNRWHKPSCRYHTKPEEVDEQPRWNENCPLCAKLPRGQACPFPPDDGYPKSYMRRAPRPRQAA